MKFSKLLLTSSISALMLAGCGDDDNKKATSGGQPGPAPEQCEGVDYDNRTLKGTIECDVTIDAEGQWTLKGPVKIGNGGQEVTASNIDDIKNNGYTLTIEAGADIRGDTDGALLITRGSKIMAEGTKEAPITFSSEDEGFDDSGEWGGVMVQGFAPHYSAEGKNSKICSVAGPCNVEGEGGDGVLSFFGGDDEADNSGVIRYVRIAEAGYVAGPNNEINGLTLQSVGHGTTLEYIQVHGNLDDGIEWFGGTANIKHAVLTNNDDDDLDFDEGYKGHIQHVLIIKDQNKGRPTGDNDPRGIEANSSDDEAVKETMAKLANITIIGSEMVRTDNDNEVVPNSKGKDGRQQPGMRLRGDVMVDLTNSLVVDYHDCVRLDNGEENMTRVTFENVITGNCEDDALVLKPTDGGDVLPQPVGTLINLDDANEEPVLDEVLAMTNDNAMLDSAVEIEELDGRTEFTFDNTDYVGAVDPDESNDDRNWWAGWTIPGSVEVK